MNLFSLHGKWYEDNENRLTSNILFFLSEFRQALLGPFLKEYLPHYIISANSLKEARIRFQPHDHGRFPDAEIILGNDTRILIECKIGANMADREQLREYATRLMGSRSAYPKHHLLVITQTDQRGEIKSHAAKIEEETGFPAQAITTAQWREVIEIFISAEAQAKDRVLSRLLTMFLKELETTMYNRIDIDQRSLSNLNEVVLTSQNSDFFEMALTHCVFWPKNNFSPSMFVGYYFTEGCRDYEKTLSHIARVKHLWHDVTINEVLTAIPEFKTIPDAPRFAQEAVKLFPHGSQSKFAIGITHEPIHLPRPIRYDHSRDQSSHPNIIPGRTTTLAKILSAQSLADLK